MARLVIEINMDGVLLRSFTVQSEGRKFLSRTYYVKRTGDICWHDTFTIWGLKAPRCTKIARKAIARMGG